MSLDESVASTQDVVVALLAHEREVTRAASLGAAQAKRGFHLFHRVGAAVVVVAELFARLDVLLGVKVDAVLAVDGAEGHLHVRIAAVRQPRGVVVVVHGVHEQDAESLGVAGGALQLHVVKLRRTALLHPAKFLRRLDGVLLRHPRPRRVHLPQKINHQIASLDPGRVLAHHPEPLTMHREHLGRRSRLRRQPPQRLGARRRARAAAPRRLLRAILRRERQRLRRRAVRGHGSVTRVHLHHELVGDGP